MFDAANVGRRVRLGLARSLISQSGPGDSDDEDASVMATFQEFLGLANSLSNSSKAKLAEMISRSSLGQMRPLQLGGMMPGYPPTPPTTSSIRPSPDRLCRPRSLQSLRSSH